MNDREQYIVELLTRVMNKAIAKENVPRRLPNNELLYRTELHVIDAIGRHPENNLTSLSDILGVTKGALSQKVKQLEKKHYIIRYRNSNNNKEVYFELTDKGKAIFKGHQDFHKQFNKKIYGLLDNISPSDYEKLKGFLQILEQHLETI